MEHVIWSNEYDVIEKLEKDIKENPDDFVAGYSKDDDFWAIAYQLNDEYLDDERANLNIEVGDEIVIIGNLGLWFGRRMGYRETHKTNIADIIDGSFLGGDDYIKWYVDDLGDMRATGSNHDGTSYYLYRSWKDGVSETQRENFLEKVKSGIATRKDITRYTQRIGDRVADVYGWKYRK